MSENSKKILNVGVAGKNPETWARLRDKLLEVIENILNTVIDTERNSTLKQEAQKFTSAVLEYGKQKLAQPGHENEKIIAEVDYLYSKKQRELAEARKINAEADKLELENSIRKLKLYLMTAKVIATKDDNDDILFIKEINSFLEILNDINQHKLLE